MTQNVPILIVILPLATALLSLCFSFLKKESAGWASILGLAGSFICSVLVMLHALKAGRVEYYLGNWEPPYGIAFSIDPMNGMIAVMASFLALLSAVYALPFLKEEGKVRYGGFYALLSLLAAGLLGMTITGDVFNLYVFLEIASLAGYGLIGFAGNKSALASFRYLLIGTIGASFYLLGIGYLFAFTGTLNMADLSERMSPYFENPFMWLPMAMILVGFGIKMALFPMHGWQPDAYSYAHPAAAGLIAGVMAKIPAYAILRFFFCLLDPKVESVQMALEILGIAAAAGILFGSVMAIAQKDFRRMLAYSSVAQIGYIVLGFAIGNPYALTGAVFHMISHAFMKSSLFMTAGGIRYRYQIVHYENFGQLYRNMPVTVFVLAVSALSMIGVPPTAGFFSKWYLGLGAAEAGDFFYLVILLLSSLLNAVYFFRVFEHIFMEPASPYTSEEDRIRTKTGSWEKGAELPWEMLVPMAAGGLMVVLLGIFNGSVAQILLETWPGVIHK